MNSQKFSFPLKMKAVSPQLESPRVNFLQLLEDYFPPLEDIEKEDVGRKAHQPVQYDIFHKFYKEIEASFWTDEDIDKDSARDASDRERATVAENRLFDYVQGFFAVSDFVVGDIIAGKLTRRIKNRDVNIVYQYIGAMENIHTITYSKVVEKAVKDTRERENILNSASRIPSIKRKIEWIHKWVGADNDIHDLDRETIVGIFKMVNSYNKMLEVLHPNATKEELDSYKTQEMLDLERKLQEKIPSLDRLIVALAIMEGVFFSGSFAVVFWFAKNNMFPGASRANQLIKNDEGKHVENGAMIHRICVKHKEPQSVVYEMVREAVEIEMEFMNDAMPGIFGEGMRGMNSKLMTRYVKWSADWVLSLFGYEPLYGIRFEDTFDFMIKQSISDTFNDFFKTEVTNYKIHGVDETAEDKQAVFTKEDDLEDI